MAGSQSAAKELLKSYLNKRMRVAISDGRVIDGNFLCTDRDSNIVLGSCEEFSSQEVLAEIESHQGQGEVCRQTRTLGLAIVPGKHIKSIAIAKDYSTSSAIKSPTAPPSQPPSSDEQALDTLSHPSPDELPTQPHPLPEDTPTQPHPPPEDTHT